MGAVYIIARILGFILGGYLSATLVKAPDIIKKHIGYCLFPQAGVALGLALLTTEHFPELGKSILSLIVGTTIIFELFGPIVTKWQLHKAGES